MRMFNSLAIADHGFSPRNFLQFYELFSLASGVRQDRRPSVIGVSDDES
jgi:hypothetical protein